MSFAATLALIAGYERGAIKLRGRADSSLGAWEALWGVNEIVGLTIASLLASLATTPYAGFHFHRIAPYGVIANLLAMPIVSSAGGLQGHDHSPRAVVATRRARVAPPRRRLRDRVSAVEEFRPAVVAKLDVGSAAAASAYRDLREIEPSRKPAVARVTPLRARKTSKRISKSPSP